MSNKKSFILLAILIALMHVFVIFWMISNTKSPIMYVTVAGAFFGIMIIFAFLFFLLIFKINITISIKKIIVVTLIGCFVPASPIISSIYFCCLTSKYSERALILMINPLNHIGVLAFLFLIDVANNWSFGF